MVLRWDTRLQKHVPECAGGHGLKVGSGFVGGASMGRLMP